MDKQEVLTIKINITEEEVNTISNAEYVIGDLLSMLNEINDKKERYNATPIISNFRDFNNVINSLYSAIDELNFAIEELGIKS